MQPIYSTAGDWVALLHEGFLFDTYGERIAWLDGKDIYTLDGEYAGFLSDDGRVLRKRVHKQRSLRAVPFAIKGGPTASHASPSLPSKIRPPARVPLAPLFAELPWQLVDVFEENPEIFEHISDLRPDWED
jgi:hypothetical protein